MPENIAITYVNIIYNIVNIYTIYDIYLLFQAKETTYAITLLTIFAWFQLLTAVFRIFKKNSIAYVISDIFQVGFIFRLFSSKADNNRLDYLLCQMLWLTIIPQIIVHFIIYFCQGIPMNSQVSEQTQLAPLINFVLLLFLLINFVVIYNKYVSIRNIRNRDKTFIKILTSNSLKISSYYMSLCSLSFLYDSLGINLLYYQLVLMFLGFIALLYLNKTEGCFELFLRLPFILLYFLQLESSELVNESNFNDNLDRKLEDLTLSLQYLSQLARVMLIIFFYDWNALDDFSKQYKDLIQEVCLFYTVISSILYFIYFLTTFIRVSLTKYIILSSQKDIEKEITKLNKKLYFTRIICIYRLEKYGWFSDGPMDLGAGLKKCKIFWQGVSKQLKSNISVQIYISIFDLKLIECLDEVENIPLEALRKLYRVSSFCLMKRFENGFLLNQTSHYLFFFFLNDKQIFIFDLISNSLSITLFYKRIQKYIPIMPAQFLYDLYD